MTLRENGLKGLFEVARTAIVRLLDLAAVPFAAIWLTYRLTGATDPLVEALLISPPIIFIVATYRMKIINALNLREKIMLRFTYAPAYRIIRAAGLIAGLTTSLLKGLTVRPKTEPITTLHSRSNTAPST